jgi:predicted regulator of Ras-like GTPase activity (Roadblock/LC7/MglB family)
LKDRIAKCNKILSENPNSQIFAALAEAHRKKGEIDKAFRVCQNGLRIHANYGSAHMVMAKINLDKGLYDWAKMEVEKAVELDGASHATDLLLAEIYIYKGEFEKAIKILDRLHKVNSNNQHVNKLREIARNLPHQSPEKAQMRIRPAGEEPPEEYAPPPQPEAADGGQTEDVVTDEKTVKTDKPEAKKGEAVTLQSLVKELNDLRGVEGVLLVNKEGLVVESEWHAEQPPDLYAALANEIDRAVTANVESCNFGKFENILVEADGLTVKFVKVADNLLLIKANDNANLGAVRLKLSTLLRNLDLNTP